MDYWANKIVVISGGAAGFGFELAKAFVHRDATVFILGRNEDKTVTAAVELKKFGRAGKGLAFPVKCDMQKRESVEAAALTIVERSGRIDAWVNNVGRSTRTRINETQVDDYREFLDINLFTAIHGTQVAQPYLEKTQGHLINIGSLSCKTAWPYLAPYTVSKFALAGFTEQVRLENRDRFHVLLVCPGPMERSDAGQRYHEDVSVNLPDAANQPGAGAPVRLISPTRIAQATLRACERNRHELVYPFKIRLLIAIRALFPQVGHWLLKKSAAKKLKNMPIK